MTIEVLESIVESHETTIQSMTTLFEKVTVTLTSLLEAANLLKDKVEELEAKINWVNNGPAT